MCDMCKHVSHGLIHINWVELSWSFILLLIRSFRSANCQAISTKANTTQVCHAWRTQSGYDCHSEGIEMLQWNSNYIYLLISQCPLSMPTYAVWVESVVDADIRAVEMCQLCVRLQSDMCTTPLSSVCMWVPLYFAVCVGCADTSQGVTAGSGTTWGAV